MALIKTGRALKDFPNGWFEDVDQWSVQCDHCGKISAFKGDIGWTVSKAREEGFVTIKGTPGEPMKWACQSCRK